MELVPPQDGGNESPAMGWAQFRMVGLFLLLLALRALNSSAVFSRHLVRGNFSAFHSAKLPATSRLTAEGWMAKVCGLGNLGVDFRCFPNFNRLE